VTLAVVASASTLVPRSVLEKVIAGGAASAAAVPARAAPPVETRAPVEAPSPPPADAMPSAAVPPEPFAQRTPRIRVAPSPPLGDKPANASSGGGSSEATLARQAVDALLAGDRSAALQHYRELSRTAPDRRVYREAVRLLSPSTSSSPQ
jgi:hypothetical protein